MTPTARRPHRALVLASFVGLALGARPVAADLIDDDEAECQQKAEGDGCRLQGEPGHCATSKCHRNDYSDGVPPKSKEVDCLVCKAAAAEPAQTPTKAATVEPTKTAGETKNTEVPQTKGCGNARIGDPSLTVGSSVLGLVLLGLAMGRRRTRRDP